MNNVRETFFLERENMLNDLKTIIEKETPSTYKPLLDQFVNFFEKYVKERLDIDVEIIKSNTNGNDIKFIINNDCDEQILLLCHYDTVFPAGTIKKRPFIVQEGRAYGPGIFDMKGGIVEVIYALKQLIKENYKSKKIVVLITSDEEIESEFSRGIIENEAGQSELALVMEPSFEGMLKTERSGVGTIITRIYGRSAHAGLDPEKGINAIYEMASFIDKLKKLNNPGIGIKLNLDVIAGGTASNVIPDYCEGIIDFRFSKFEDSDMIMKELEAINLDNPDARKEIDAKLRPPMVKNEKTDEFFKKMQESGKKIGIDIKETYVSGGSDGNFCSYYCPVIDGLGPVGGGAHADNEFIFIDSIPERAALIYQFIMDLK